MVFSSTSSRFLPSHEKHSDLLVSKSTFLDQILGCSKLHSDTINYVPVCDNSAVNRIKMDKHIYQPKKAPFHLGSNP